MNIIYELFDRWVSMLAELFSNPDFQLNLLAEAMGVITETALIYLIISRVITMRENKRWKPARVNVARRLIEVHRNLFNAARQVIDPNFHVDKKLHNVPNSVSQEAANHWGKRVFIPPLRPDLDRLKKTVEYNNSALDSTLMPLVSDFLLAAEVLLSATNFLIDAYDPSSQNEYSTLMPRVGRRDYKMSRSKLNPPVQYVKGTEGLQNEQLKISFLPPFNAASQA